MIKRLIFLCCVIISGDAVFGQCPTSIFTLPTTSCLEESIYPYNSSLNASDYLWDLCSGDLLLTPDEERVLSDNVIFRGRSIRVKKAGNNEWVGFVIDQAQNRLVRFDFGNNLQNNPILINLENPSNALSGAYDFDLIKEAESWYMLVTNSLNNKLIRLAFGNNLLNNNPAVDDLGDFGLLNVPNGIKIQDEAGVYYVFVTNGGDNSVTRLDFGNSILNMPIANSFSIGGVSNPRSIDIIKDCTSWVGMVSSYSNNKLFYLNFQNGLDQPPSSGEIAFYTSYNFPAALSIVFEGGQYYTMIQSALGDLYKLSFGSSIADFSGVGENLGDFGLNNNFATEWVNDESDWYGFSIELGNASTPGQGNLIRYTFPSTCSATPATSALSDPQFSYSTSGVNQVTLIAYNASGNNNATSQSIAISPSTAPQILATSSGNCLSNPVSFFGQELSGNITAWNWDFGDGVGTSMLQDPGYSYGAIGDYQVRLTVTDANGCNNLFIDTVSIYEEPIPNFSAPAGTLCINNGIDFINTTIGETGSVVSWTWDFNGEGTSTEKDPTFTFLTSGNKTVTLTSSLPGCANVVQQNIFIEESPTTVFSGENVCNTLATQFTDASTGTGINGWLWDFGDGNTSVVQNPSHIYANPGLYDVSLTVSNTLGCATTLMQQVYNHALPVPAFMTDLPCSGGPLQFTDQSLVQDANMVAWEWEFDDPSSGSNTSTEQNPTHVFAAPGDYAVNLNAYSQFGCVDSVTQVVSVIQGPDIAFDWVNACASQPTTFTNETITYGLPITEIVWIIDGTYYTDAEIIEHTFSAPGTYVVSLGITLNNLCGYTLSQDIEVETAPTVNFSVLETCLNNEVQLTDLTEFQPGNQIVTRNWRLDGQLQLATDSVITVELSPGEHLISLDAITSSGCSSMLSKDESILGTPQANFSVPYTTGAAPFEVQFENESTGAVTYIWLFGEAGNSTSTETNPSFIYSTIGDFEARLVAMATSGCADTSMVQTIQVTDPSTGVDLLAFNAIPSDQNLQVSMLIKNTGTVLLEQNLELAFRVDNGPEITEVFQGTIHAGQELPYIPSFTVGNAIEPSSICVLLRIKEQDDAVSAGDQDCISISNNILVSDPYPNPASEYIQVDVILSDLEPVLFKMMDRNGALIYENQFEDTKIGLNEFIIQTAAFRAGLYLIQLQAGEVHRELKAVIVK